MTLSNNVYYNYTYNERGLRISKTSSNGLNIKYLYDGDKLVSQQSSNESLDFLYDESGYLYGFIYNNSTRYYYVRDVLHNILGIVNESGSLVVKYAYNAYGVIQSITGSLASTIGVINPFRYKGYYYDNESGMYYCKSRYYVPEWCRWLNNDAALYTQTNSYYSNAFVYCNNSPINNVDEDGKIALLLSMIIGAFIGAVIGAAGGAFHAYRAGEDVALGAAKGAIFGGITGLFGGVGVAVGGIGVAIFAGAAGGAIGGASAEIWWQNKRYGKIVDGVAIAENAGIGLLLGAGTGLAAIPSTVGGFIVAIVFLNLNSTMLALIIDLIRWYYKKQKEKVYDE